jgi:hypothetical protein
VAAQARKILGWTCDGDPRVECHDVSGEALGTVVLSFTIVGRDQWWCRQLAQDILNRITWGLTNDVETKLDLQSYRQEPHTHRGYAHGRTKPYREPAPRQPRSPEGTEQQPRSEDPTPGTSESRD